MKREFELIRNTIVIAFGTMLPKIATDLLKENDKFQESENNESGIYRYNDPKFILPQCTITKIADVLCHKNIILMHGAVVGTNGQAYMFMAPSGVGKTTRAQLWIEEIPESIIVNGDKPFIRITDNAAYAYGTPWCGKEGFNTNVKMPIQAIFLLERAETNKDNAINEITFSEAFVSLLTQTYLPEKSDAFHKTLGLLSKLKDRVRFFRF